MREKRGGRREKKRNSLSLKNLHAHTKKTPQQQVGYPGEDSWEPVDNFKNNEVWHAYSAAKKPSSSAKK